MALSGSFGKDFSGGYRLQVDWSATQNITNNTSTVMTRLYLISKGSSWTINSSASKYVELNIYTGSNNISSNTVAGLASLGGNQKKEIFWHQVTVNHDNDGSKGITIFGIFDINVTLNGSYVGRVDVSQYVQLDTIPRASTITTQPDITAGRPHVFSIQRASSEFTHTVSFHIVEGNGTETQVGLLYDQGTGGTFDFSDADVYTMYQKLNKASSIKCRIKCTTLRYGTIIGTTQRDGTCYNWNSGYASFAGVKNYGDSIDVTINNGHPKMKYDVEFRIGTVNSTGGTLIKTQSNMNQGVGTVSFTAEKTALLNATPNVTGATGTARVTTYWVNGANRVQVADSIPSDFWWNGGNALVPPTFTGAFTYADTNTTVTAITANNQYIVQNKSTVTVTLPVANRALPNSGATMKEYIVTLGNREVKQNWSSSAQLTFDLGTIDASTNISLAVKAVDSRGLYTTQYKTVNIVPYAPPTLSATVTRKNNFETSTEIMANGTITPLNVNGTNKNAVTLLQYRWKTTIGGSWSSYANFTYTTTMPNFTATKITSDFDNTKAYSFEIIVRDSFGATSQVQVNRTIDVGKPLMFIDYELKTIGVNKFPSSSANGMEIEGKLEADGITTRQGIFQLASVLPQQGNGATEFSYNAQTSTLNIVGRNKTTNTTHDITLNFTGKIIAKEIWANTSGGIIFDTWGNIKGQPTANSSNTWSIQDTNGRIRLLLGIGAGTTQPNEFRAYTNGHDFYHDGNKFLSLYTHENYTGRCIQFGNDGGILKWYTGVGRLEARNSGNTNWCELAGNLNNASSREFKDNIEIYEHSAMELINSTVAKTYTYKDDEHKVMKVGLIAEEAPKILVGANGDTVDSYGMATLSFKGLQEHDIEIKYLHQEITELKKEIQILKKNKGEM